MLPRSINRSNLHAYRFNSPHARGDPHPFPRPHPREISRASSRSCRPTWSTSRLIGLLSPTSMCESPTTPPAHVLISSFLQEKGEREGREGGGERCIIFSRDRRESETERQRQGGREIHHIIKRLKREGDTPYPQETGGGAGRDTSFSQETDEGAREGERVGENTSYPQEIQEREGNNDILRVSGPVPLHTSFLSPPPFVRKMFETNRAIVYCFVFLPASPPPFFAKL